MLQGSWDTDRVYVRRVMVIMEEEKRKEYVMHNEQAQKNELNDKKLNI